jgi:hypothetical protein
MKYTVEMVSDYMIYVPGSVKIYIQIKKLYWNIFIVNLRMILLAQIIWRRIILLLESNELEKLSKEAVIV